MPRNDLRIQHVRGFALRAGLLASCAAASVASFAAEPVTSSLVTPAAVATPNTSDRARAYFGDHALTDQDGQTHRFYSDLLQGRVVLINVIFTHCPSACPMMTERLKLVRKQVGEGFGRDVYFLSLSVDPARDTPEALKRFAERHNVDLPGWRFLVSDAQTLKTLLSRLGQWTDSPEDHTTLLIAGNAAKSHWTKLRPDAPPEQIAAELARLK